MAKSKNQCSSWVVLDHGKTSPGFMSPFWKLLTISK